MDTRNIVDLAQQDNANEFRSALQAAIQDKVAQHIEVMKQNIAQNMFNQSEEEVQDQEIENT